MSNKIIELGRKLLALSLKGEGGEKENAQRMLDAFLEKHNLELKDIEPQTRSRRIVKKVDNGIRQMMINLVGSIVGKDFNIVKCRGKGYYAIEMNDQEWEIFTERFEVYRKALKRELVIKRKEQRRELKLLEQAFISKHDLYSKDSDDTDNQESTLTPEELEEIMQIIRLRDGLKDINFYKKLNN
jgi:hypothetical protein